MDKLEILAKDLYVFDTEKGIYSIYKKKWCEGYVSKRNGYLTVKLQCTDGKRRAFQYHRVLCYIFKEIPEQYSDIPLESLQIDHINGDKLDNRIDNLRWCTGKENCNNPITLRRKSVAFKGRIITDEWRRNMSKAGKGKVITKEWREKISNSLKGEKNHFFGKHHSEETKAKLRAANIGNLNNGSSKTLYQYDLDNNLVNTYASTAEAIRQNPTFEKACISECCHHKQKTHRGFKWSHTPL